MQESDVTTIATLVIPFPSYIPRARGPHAVGKFGTVLKAKCTKEEHDTTQAAANKLGLTKSEFIRWVSYHAARVVLGQQDKDNEHREDRDDADGTS